MPLALSAKDLERLFPAYMEVNADGTISACGPSLSNHAGRDLLGCRFADEFEIARPHGAVSIDALQDDQTIVLSYRRNASLKLQGVKIGRAHCYYLLLAHAPNVEDVQRRVKYCYADFAPYDGSQNLFLAAQIRKGLLEDAHALSQQLKTEKFAAEAANIAKSNFLACMSHEIRTPLNGVLGMAAALMDTELSAEQEEMLTVLNESGETLLTLLNDILDLSKIDAGQIEIEEIAFTPEELVRSIAAVYKLKCAEKGVRFVLSVDGDILEREYLGDPLRIRQILNNLVANAVKFTEQGEVRVTAAEEPADYNLVFTVSDTGIGMNKETLQRLFAPFVQADSSITRRFGGTGLGLNISKRLCDLMNGKISAESAEGKGSRFRFSIPVKPATLQIGAGEAVQSDKAADLRFA